NPLDEEFVQVYVRAPKRVAGMGMEMRQQIARVGDVFDMQLKAGETLTGRVTGPDGKPVSGARVSAGGSSYAMWNEVASALTKADGTYVISDAAPYSMDEYRKLRAEQRANMAALKHDKDTYAVFVTPPTLSVQHPGFASKRTTYDKIPGNQDVQLEPAAHIAGQVVF